MLAAGRGSRFDGIKQLAPFRGRPLIEHAVEAIATALDAPPVVVLGHEAERIAAEADLGGAEIAVCPDWDRGQAASLRTGVEAILARRPRATAAAIVLGDQPLITAAAIRRVVSAPSAPFLRATYDGRPGHPVLLDRSLFAAATGQTGDQGLRGLIAERGAEPVECGDLGSDADIDTTEDLARLE